jgi:hypothetical protein
VSTRTRFRFIALAAVVLLLTAGCSTYSPRTGTGGQSNAAAQAQLAAIPGIASATLQAVPWYNVGEGGLFSSAGMNIVVHLTVQEGYSIPRPARLMAFVLATAWSAQDTVPKGSIVVTVAGGVRPSFDWLQTGRSIKLEAYDLTGDDLSGGFDVSGADVAKRFGGVWPHKPVATPAGLISAKPLSASALKADAVTSPTVSRGTITAETSETCISARLTRNSTNGVAFAGSVTAEWMSEGKVVKRTVADAPDGRPAVDIGELCWPAKERGHDKGYSVRVTATDPSGVFRSVTKTSNTA